MAVMQHMELTTWLSVFKHLNSVSEALANPASHQIYTPQVVEVDELEESVRGAGGFGSTG